MSATRRLLLLSNSTQHGSGYLEHCSQHVKEFFSRYGVTCVLFVPYACKDYDKYAEKVKSSFQKFDLKVESIHEKSDPLQAVKQCQGIFIGGGNTFLLLKTLYDENLVEAIRHRVLEEKIPYMGASAGTNVATVSICTTNDMPIVYPPSFSALALVPFNINPHYVDADPDSKHMGETREDRIKEYHSLSGVPPVIGLKEGCILAVTDKVAEIKGLTGAKLFESGKDPVEYLVGSDVSFLLSG